MLVSRGSMFGARCSIFRPRSAIDAMLFFIRCSWYVVPSSLLSPPRSPLSAFSSPPFALRSSPFALRSSLSAHDRLPDTPPPMRGTARLGTVEFSIAVRFSVVRAPQDGTLWWNRLHIDGKPAGKLAFLEWITMIDADSSGMRVDVRDSTMK